ncbi:MAG: sensor histidine kinase, partial [Ilumatobacteraceae bacterium]
AARAGRTVDDLLELSRIELSRPGASGDDGIDRVTVDQVVETAIGRVTELALGRSIGVTALAPVDGSGHRVGAAVLHGDRRQLESALGNLVENAVRYSGDGGSVQIRSSVEGEVVEFTVVDHGIGIPQRDLDRIFERFYRVDRARSRDTGGTGLGLSSVRHVANNHGGTVSVRSTEGEGSTFVLRLPIVVETGPDTGRAEREGVA